jgi:solute:Na+ symporter, SSS family
VTISTKAVREDLEAGQGRRGRGDHPAANASTRPRGSIFERVARTNPEDPGSPRIGIGRFHAELWVLSWFGIDFSGSSKAQLSAVRFGFDAMFPFVLLFLFSAVTRPVPKADLDRFFAKVHTPVQRTPEEEERALRHAVERYEEVEKRKLFPGSNWEIMKPGWIDVLGFGGSWLLVGLIILLLWLVTTWGT